MALCASSRTFKALRRLLHVRGAGTMGDDAWRDFLAQQYERNTQRNARILDLLGEIQTAARQNGIPLLPLKGASFITWLYDDPGVRPMSDIDLFTRPEYEADAGRIMEGAGFVSLIELNATASSCFLPIRSLTCAANTPTTRSNLSCIRGCMTTCRAKSATSQRFLAALA